MRGPVPQQEGSILSTLFDSEVLDSRHPQEHLLCLRYRRLRRNLVEVLEVLQEEVAPEAKAEGLAVLHCLDEVLYQATTASEKLCEVAVTYREACRAQAEEDARG